MNQMAGCLPHMDKSKLSSWSLALFWPDPELCRYLGNSLVADNVDTLSASLINKLMN